MSPSNRFFCLRASLRSLISSTDELHLSWLPAFVSQSFISLDAIISASAMPVSHRPSQANLRRARSIPANILHSARSEDQSRGQPEVARQYALAAANRAFHLAQEAKGLEPKKDEEAKRTPTMSRRQTLRLTDETLVNEPPFVTSNGVSSTAYNSGLTDGNVQPAPEPIAPPSTDAQTEDAVTALTSGRKVSGQSSFQRMKKPKSMFSLRKRATADTFSPPISPGRGTPTLRRSPRRSPDKQSFPTGFSPGRPQPTAEELLQQLPNPFQTTYNQDLAVQIARDEFIRQIKDESAHQSSLVKNDRPKIVKHFRHTLRRNSNAPEHNGETAEGGVEGKPDTKSRSRRISQGFRATLRRLFRGSPSRELPAQQVDATRKHYDSAQNEEDDPNDPIRHPDIPAPCPEMVARLSYRQSHETVIPSPATARHSHPPSIRSMHSSESLRTGSRVTSWANSTTSKGTHLTTGMDPQTAERARLSVIQENAPHRPSSSAMRYRGIDGSLVAFRQPIRRSRDIGDIDPEKLAQDLRQNIQRKRLAAGPETEKGSIRSKSAMPVSLDDKTVRRRSRRSTLRPEPTESDDDWSPSPQLQVRKQRGITYPSSDDDDIFEPSVPRLRGQPNRALHHKLSLQDIADLNEGTHPSMRHSLRESRSTFFPGKGQYPNYQLSPYRKAMSAVVDKDSGDFQSIDREITPESQESASVYSRRTTGTPHAKVVLDDAGRDALPGTAYVEENPVSHYRSLVGRARGTTGTVSHRSSGSWKGWMASEVSKLEGAEDYNADLHLPMAEPELKGIGHVRESAQGHDAEGSEDDATRSVSGPRPTLDAVRFFSGFRLPKRNVSNESKETTSRRGSFSIKEDSDASSAKSRLRILLPGLRASSNESEGSNHRIPLLSHKVSEPALKLPTVPESPMTPFSKFMASNADSAGGSPLDGYHLRERAATSSNTRHSPERDARLRRLQSSILSGNRAGHQGPGQYPWLQRYRDSHFYEEFSPPNSENKPYGKGSGPFKDEENEPRQYRGSMEDDPFPEPSRYSRRGERSSSGEPAFI